jgi:malate dehydrogenase (quinone)
MTTPNSSSNPDAVLVGAGIMSATLAVILKELDPSLKIEIHEVLESAAQESSNAWNNAGTGHAALCELNYTPQKSDGSIDISKALEVNTEFDLSRQLWAYLVKEGAIKDPRSFIHRVPHMSFVRGAENVAFLQKRFEALSAHPCYHGMEYSDNKKQIGQWIPLVMEGRDPSDNSRGDADGDRYGRGLWRPHPNPHRFSKRKGRILHPLFQSSTGSQPQWRAMELADQG